MNTQKSLVIASPCHANWNKMSPTEKGRFCASCTKEVVDFRNKTKEDIIEYLENYKGEGQTCGQFSSGQIDKVGKNYINSSVWKRIGISMMAFLGVFSLKDAKAQKPKMGKVAIKGDISYQDWNEQKQVMEVTLFGSVRTLDGQKIAGAEIKFNADGKPLAVTKTISNGTFAVQVKIDKSMKAITMYTHAIGYERKISIIPNPQKDRIKVDVIMESEIMVLGEIAIETDTVATEDTLTKCSILAEDTTHTNKENIEKIPDENTDPIIPDENNSDTLLPKLDLINEEKNRIRIYPNPSSNNAVIEWKDDSENSVEIYDLNGKRVWSTVVKGNKLIFNTANLANGNYLVKISSKHSGKTETAKLVVSH